jgi:metal-responsive CopG/Arc/MetJ family transcriptional regulator
MRTIISFSLEPSLLKKVEDLKTKNKLTRSRVFVEAVKDYIKKEEVKEEEEERKD